jgi:phosphoribosylformimino-5-aminoimidazole carboxamide ribotide isomerase
MSNHFTIIPVLDLKSGVVVHARAGERARYLPIRTPLANTSEPQDVLAGLLSLAPFHRLYIADLDAIEGRASHSTVIRALAQSHTNLEIWVDGGLPKSSATTRTAARIFPVVGSESLSDLAVLTSLRPELGDADWVLSLDYRGNDFLGPALLERTTAHWPANVIVMSLARVGTGLGPDIERLSRIKDLAGSRQVWAAGGVRGREDLVLLATMGFAGALVATALHDGRLSREALAAFV